MARRRVQGLLCVDDDMQDGYVLVEGEGHPDFVMSAPTYRALSRCAGAGARLVDTLQHQRGMFLLPRSVIEPEAAEDLHHALSLGPSEPSDACIYGCLQDPVREHESGFRLCQHHADLLSSWDDLVA